MRRWRKGARWNRFVREQKTLIRALICGIREICVQTLAWAAAGARGHGCLAPENPSTRTNAASVLHQPVRRMTYRRRQLPSSWPGMTRPSSQDRSGAFAPDQRGKMAGSHAAMTRKARQPGSRAIRRPEGMLQTRSLDDRRRQPGSIPTTSAIKARLRCPTSGSLCHTVFDLEHCGCCRWLAYDSSRAQTPPGSTFRRPCVLAIRLVQYSHKSGDADRYANPWVRHANRRRSVHTHRRCRMIHRKKAAAKGIGGRCSPCCKRPQRSCKLPQRSLEFYVCATADCE